MAKYETDVQLPSVAAIQKPGAERYAVPLKVAEQVQNKLADGSAVEASWEDGCKLSVTVERNGDQPEHHMQTAQAALIDVVGPESVVAPFHKVAGSTEGA